MRDRLLKLRREQMRRPLPMRVFALFMAVVMVLSVITVSNTARVVEAETIVNVESSYINSIFGFGGVNSINPDDWNESKAKTINVPVGTDTEIKFNLPTVRYITNKFSTTLYTLTAEKEGSDTETYYFSTEAACNSKKTELTDAGYTCSATSKPNTWFQGKHYYKWVDNDGNDLTDLSVTMSATSANTTVKLVRADAILYQMSSTENGDYTDMVFEDEDETVPSVTATLSFSVVTPAAPTVTNTASGVSVSDADENNYNTPFMTISESENLVVMGYVNETNVYELYVGMEVTILSRVDEQTFKKLGVNMTCEPKYQTKKLYHT